MISAQKGLEFENFGSLSIVGIKKNNGILAL